LSEPSRSRNLLEMLVRHLQPFDHPGDVQASHERWSVDPGELFTEWYRELIHNCRTHARCDDNQRCIYFRDSREAAENWRICKTTYAELETGRLEVKAPSSDDEGPERGPGDSGS
jgi:hypothetical protein